MAATHSKTIAVSLVVIMLLGTASPAAGALGGTTVAPQVDEVSAGNDSVSVWERAPVPLRVDGTNAATSITNPDVSVNIEGEGESTPVGNDFHVFNEGDSVTVEFAGRGGTDPSAYAGDAQLVVARLNASVEELQQWGEDSLGNGSDLNLTAVSGVESVADLIRDEVNGSDADANGNATFRTVNTEIGTDGTFEATFTPGDEGHYAVVAATGHNFSATDGDLSLDGETTIVGMDALSVQQEPSTVTAPAHVTPGESATFTVDSYLNEQAGGANHTLLLYDAATYESQSFTLDLDDDLRDLQTNEIALNHSLKYINGTATFDSNMSVGGIGLGSGMSIADMDFDGDFDGSVELAERINQTLEAAENRTGTNFSEIAVRTTGTETLNVSATGVTGVESETTLDLRTKADWSGEFRWVHVATDGEGQALTTESGTLQVSDDTTAPTLDITPEDGTVFDAGTDEITFTAEYSDAGAGIDEDSVSLAFDGVTRSSAEADTTIGANQATFTATGLENGTSHTFDVTVSDAADNTVSESVTVSINETPDTTAPTLDITPEDGTAFDSDTEEITFNVTYADDDSGIDVGSVSLVFDGEPQTASDANTVIGANNASFTATDLEEDTTYTFNVSVADLAGNEARENVTVSVNKSSGGGWGGGGGFPGGGFPGGGGDDGDGDGETPPTDRPPVTVTPTPGGQGVKINISIGQAGGQFSANFSGTGADVSEPGNSGVSLAGISGFLSGSSGEITLNRGKEANTPDLSNDPNAALEYFTIQESAEAGASGVTFTFRVQKDRLQQRGMSPDDVAMYRYNSGQWNELETTRVGETGTAYRYEAASPGFSTFAVGQRGALDQPTTTTTEPGTTTTTDPGTTTTTGPGTSTTTDPGTTTTTGPGTSTTTDPGTPTVSETTTPGDDDDDGLGLLPILLILLLLALGAGGYFAWREGHLDDVIDDVQDTVDNMRGK